MPIFEWKCPSCAVEKQTLQKHSDPPPQCAQCTMGMVKKISLTSFSLRGNGWAKDNYGLKRSKSN